MKKLFIIGNGFDIAHGLHSNYSYFKKFLIENYNRDSYDDFFHDIPTSVLMPDGSEKYDDNEIVGFIIDAVNNKEKEDDSDEWNDFEERLGKLDYNLYFSTLSYPYDEDEDDDYDLKKANYDEGIGYQIRDAFLNIERFFTEWIKQINIKEAELNKEFKALINTDNDIFMTFNYTSTLEDIYGAKNVFHIHGKTGEKLIFGHGNNNELDPDEYEIGADFGLSELHSCLRKPVRKIIEKNRNFFNSLSDVEEIYTYGFSYSVPDRPYIREICRSIKNKGDAVWYIHDFNKPEEFKDIIKESGFNGEIRSFHV